MKVRELKTRFKFTANHRQLSQITRSISLAEKGLVALAAAGASAASSLFFMTANASQIGNQLKINAKRTGLTAEQYQALSFAVSQTGARMAELDQSFQYFSRTLGDAMRGNFQALKKFHKLGVRVRDIPPGANQTAVALQRVAKQLDKVGSKAEANSAMMQLFNQTGVRARLAISKVTGGLGKFRDELKKIGFLYDKEAIKKSTEFHQSLDKLSFTIHSVTRRVGMELEPQIKQLVDEFEDWFQKNKDIIRQDINKFVHGLVKVTSAAYDVLSKLGDILGFVLKHSKFLSYVLDDLIVLFKMWVALRIVRFIKNLGIAAIGAGAGFLKLKREAEEGEEAAETMFTVGAARGHKFRKALVGIFTIARVGTIVVIALGYQIMRAFEGKQTLIGAAAKQLAIFLSKSRYVREAYQTLAPLLKKTWETVADEIHRANKFMNEHLKLTDKAKKERKKESGEKSGLDAAFDRIGTYGTLGSTRAVLGQLTGLKWLSPEYKASPAKVGNTHQSGGENNMHVNINFNGQVSDPHSTARSITDEIFNARHRQFTDNVNVSYVRGE